MAEIIKPSLKNVYLQTLKDSVREFYRPQDNPPQRGIRAWFDVLENFNETQMLGRDFGVDYKETIEAILEVTPIGLRKDYFSFISPALPPQDVEEICAQFGLGKI
ncbi:hypothetical protein MUP46_03640 [Patescibacteria group bacterium]|nr:hypothetical protein [Patescibacteria group bacterium]